MTQVPQNNQNSQNNQNDQNNIQSNSNNDNLDLNNSHSNDPIQNEQNKDKPRDRSALNFITQLLSSNSNEFTEDNAKKLFDFYHVNNSKTDAKLEPKDVRIFLFDLLEAMKLPLVVPDECLDAVLHELCLNDKGSISWVEWKSFFVFLQDKPLQKILELVNSVVSKEELRNARFLRLIPKEANNENNNNDNNNNNNNESAQPSVSVLNKDDIKNTIISFLPEAKKIFLFYTSNNTLLALVCGTFENVLQEPLTKGFFISDCMFDTTIDNFNIISDSFPPLLRTSKFSSKVARTLATGIVSVKTWDERNLKIREKTSKLTKQVSRKLGEFDEKYQVGKKFNETTQKMSTSIKEFDDKHKISQTVSDTAKNVDEKLKISETVSKIGNSIKQNEKFQLFSRRISGFFSSTKQTFSDISSETSQIVNEKSLDNMKQQALENGNISNVNNNNNNNTDNNQREGEIDNSDNQNNNNNNNLNSINESNNDPVVPDDNNNNVQQQQLLEIN